MRFILLTSHARNGEYQKRMNSDVTAGRKDARHYDAMMLIVFNVASVNVRSGREWNFIFQPHNGVVVLRRASAA